YELFNGRTPAIGFLKPFGCHVMILNTLDNLGKFEAKGDEGYFIGYSMSSKTFRPHDESSSQVPKGSGNLNPTVSSSDPPADQMETLIVESRSPVPTACLNDSQESSSEARLISKRVANQEETPSMDNILSL
nr:ribonuclease H-like domain-containing protein [Tanacetum cinerariifolium]